MIRIFTLLMILLPVFSFGQTTELLFSEYAEGHSNNKYYEIYNGTGAAVDLTGYTVILYTNGGVTAQSTLVLSGTLANNATYVVANSSADITIKDLADTLHATCGYNGDDALELRKNGLILDAFGEVGVDPGSSWTIAGNATAAVDKVLRRKASVCSPTDVWSVSFGMTEIDSQWEIDALPFNAANMPTLILSLGSHTTTCVNPCTNPPAVNAGADLTVCAGTSVSLTATGAGVFTWDNGVSQGVPFTPTATTTYTVTVDDGVCTNTDQVTITVNALPVVTISENANVLTASLTGVDYEWKNCVDSTVVATTQVFTPTANGSYFVEVTDLNGCTGSSTCVAVTTLGLESKTAMSSFNISPNPTKGKVTITAAGNESASVVIFNALGKQLSKVNNIQNGSVIDFSEFNNGVYMVQITSNKGTKVQRVVKN